jgi:hypothetical protein
MIKTPLQYKMQSASRGNVAMALFQILRSPTI